MERFLYAVHISERQTGWMGKCVQINPGKMKARGFFHAEAYLPKKRKKIPVKMSQMNAINVLMFHFWQ